MEVVPCEARGLGYRELEDEWEERICALDRITGRGRDTCINFSR
jgi:hypothetical protein